MASNIVPDTIDDTYPVAGEDNDSQGFRDNFNIIKTNFTYSKSEIEDLQNNTAKTNANSVFFENTISRFVALQQSSKRSTASFPSGAPTNDIDFQNGHFHEVTLSSPVTARIINWPAIGEVGEYAEMYILIKTDGSGAHAITFDPKYSNNTLSSTMYVIDGSEFAGTKSITASSTTSESKLVKCFTYNNGVDVFFEYLGMFITAT